MHDELLKAVASGKIPSEGEVNDFINAIDRVNGKKCKFCSKVFSKSEIISGHKSEMIQINNEFLSHGKGMLPCFGCSKWRFISTDFE